ncbi:MAG TPA: hypothetical protein VHG89_04895 [Verrucomicrobiae bacterium]|nr:hypothetical protein [Verrucomicrobiae bacterium]
MITSVNNHVLLPHPANWGDSPPTSQRVWQTEIVAALTGAEQRQALRAVSRRQLTFTVTARTLPERARLEARVEVATKSGLACAPLHGRACVLAQNANGNSLTLNPAVAWNWQAGDYAFLMDDDQTFDALPVAVVNGLTLDFGLGTLNFNWPQGRLVWPLIFGKFSADKANALDGFLSEQKLTIAELVGARSVPLGVIPASVPGIGTTLIGSTFIVQ